MATKQISQLPSTSVSNDSDLLMTRQGSEDRAVAIDKVRNLGTEAGQSLGVGGYGIGGNAIPITDLFASNNADLITRDGIYQINGAANVPVAAGEIIHTQSSATSATQDVTGENEEKYFRKKVAGVWKAWVLVSTGLVQTGFISASNFYLTDTTSVLIPDFDIEVVPQNANFIIGPTGSGADYEWGILDSLPTNAKYVEVLVKMKQRVSSAENGAGWLVQLKGLNTVVGDSPLSSRVSITSVGQTNDVILEDSRTVKVTVVDRKFKINWIDAPALVTSRDYKLKLSGFGV